MNDLYESLVNTHFVHLHNEYLILKKVMLQREYYSILEKRDLEFKEVEIDIKKIDFPGLLYRCTSTRGERSEFVYESDYYRPLVFSPKKPYSKVKYISVTVDCPRICLKDLQNPSKPLFITDSFKLCDSMASRGLCTLCIYDLDSLNSSELQEGKFVDYLEYSFEPIVWYGREVRIVCPMDLMYSDEIGPIFEVYSRFLVPKGAILSLYFVPKLGDFSNLGFLSDLFGNLKVEKLPEILTDNYGLYFYGEDARAFDTLVCKAYCTLAIAEFCSHEEGKNPQGSFSFTTREILNEVYRMLGRTLTKEKRHIFTRIRIIDSLSRHFSRYGMIININDYKWTSSKERLVQSFHLSIVNFPKEFLSKTDSEQ